MKAEKWIFTRSVLPYGALNTNIGLNKEVFLTNFLTYVKHIFNSEESWREDYVGSYFFCQFSLSFRKKAWLWYSGLLYKDMLNFFLHTDSLIQRITGKLFSNFKNTCCYYQELAVDWQRPEDVAGKICDIRSVSFTSENKINQSEKVRKLHLTD